MSEADQARIEVRDAPESDRYEIEVDGELAGFANYKLGEASIAFTHTEVDPDRGGMGLGSRLVEYAVTDARSRNLRIHPMCPFVRDWVEQHPEE